MNERNDFQTGGVFDLSPDDQRLLDALLEAGFDRARLSRTLGRALTAQDHQRLAALSRLMGFLDDYPVDDAEPALLHAALARIDRHEDETARRLRFDVAMDDQAARRGFRIRLPDFVTVAAIVLIAVGVLWPVLGSMRNSAMDAACANNLRSVGYGFSQYSNDNNGSLPYAMAGPVGTWETLRNAMNLNPMVQGGYCDAGHMNCPGHRHLEGGAIAAGEPSYSYRWFSQRGLNRWNTSRVTVILGDLNPLVDAARSGWEAPPLSVSVNHGGRGQNVLTTDGATLWLEQPLIGGAGKGGSDNIWIPNSAPSLRPGIEPDDDTDVFLVH